MTPTSPARKLTNAQVALLELFNVEMNDEEVKELRGVLMQHYRTKLEKEVDQLQQRTDKSTSQMEEEMRFDNRSERLRTIRQQQS